MYLSYQFFLYWTFLTKRKLWWIFVTLGSRNDGDKNPVWFTLGMQEVLKGWDKGLQNMCTGERRKLTIPPSLAYGKEGKGNIDTKNMLERICCIKPLLLLVFHHICASFAWPFLFVYRQDPPKQYPHFWHWAHGHQKWPQVTWLFQADGSKWWLEAVQAGGVKFF